MCPVVVCGNTAGARFRNQPVGKRIPQGEHASAGAHLCFQNRYLVTGPQQLISGDEATQSGAENQDPLAVAALFDACIRRCCFSTFHLMLVSISVTASSVL